ncbi:MAG: site-2 protease family protein [Armatimonadota bacterium]|nr:site-2 protease family protein [Armatimonadota bacterium]MDR7519270.1 site-2 protease family protein [Armatimonadota bacterium]MDR7549744.1 site-2 protease family protein [Armatimonadota bacterium]
MAERLEQARQIVATLIPGAVADEGAQPTIWVPSADGLRERFLELQRRLGPLELLPLLRMRGGRPAVLLVPKPPPGRWAWQTNLLLFLATVGTTFAAGYLQSLGLVQLGFMDSPVTGGLAFSLSLLLILGAHEMGHKLVAVRRGIDASLPYFIPIPPVPPFVIGTMGAVIVTRTPSPNRDSLMELGASGPIAGFLAAIPVLIYGVMHSFPIQPGQVEGVVVFPDPLLVQWLVRWLRDLPPGTDLLMHPVMFAGWIGLMVTSLNLLPSGMLDGGHAVRAAAGARWHHGISVAGVVIAVVIGAWVMAILMLLLLRRGHVGPLDDLTPLSPSRRVMGLALVAIFALSVSALFPLTSIPDLFR